MSEIVQAEGQAAPDEAAAAKNKKVRAPKKAAPPLTGKQQLASTIKSVRDLLRKDAGLSGDTDRLPQLTWMLFLKQLDDFELAREEELGADYQAIIPEKLRWREWADPRDGEGKPDFERQKSPDELVTFVNSELFPELSQLSSPNPDNPLPNIIGQIFRGNSNRIRSGYIMREVLDKLSTINFNSSEDIHAVSHFYETMLREMRDAAGDAGEFYTPRPVVRFIIDRLKLQKTDIVLDPACGTGGFLVEAYEQLKPQVQNATELKRLQKNIRGIEKKPMPYLLAVLNLLLHGLEYPTIRENNALTTPVTQIAPSEQVNVIATNPPFGGEEEKGILNNFPKGLQTAETALLFFQYIMALLKRPGGRCGVVLPNGFLFGGGIAAEIKRQLLTEFNLHTIVRLPNGVFAPYTGIPTNLLFFEACSRRTDDAKMCTSEVWFYELPLPEGRSSYSKTKPLQYEDFEPCQAWWDNRTETLQAWKVPVQQILDNGCNLDIKNPNAAQDLEHLPPDQLVADIIAKEHRILDIMAEIKQALSLG